jgi:hypothetical protein
MIVGPVAGLGSGRCAQDPRGMLLGEGLEGEFAIGGAHGGVGRPDVAAALAAWRAGGELEAAHLLGRQGGLGNA